MEMEGLRSELERLFELDELLALSSGLLGFDPDEVGGTGGKASFVRALTDHCAERGAVEALCDAVWACKPNADPALTRVGQLGLLEPDELSPGDALDGYAIERKLGDGALGICYLASRREEDFRIKVLHPEATRDPRGVHRFLTFCRMLSRIGHPALPADLKVGRSDGRYYVAHRWFEGEPLSARLARTGAVPASEALGILLPVASALAALHDARLSHGNVKPENVLVGPGEGDLPGVLLLDAGSDLLRERRVPNGRIPLLSLASPKTIAPERLQGDLPRPSADVYAVGATAYELVSGSPPFAGEDAIESAINHLRVQPPPPSRSAPEGWLSSAHDDLILRLLSKDPEQRPADGRELERELRALQTAVVDGAPLSEADVDALAARLLEDPANAELAQRLEAAAFGPARRSVYATFAEAAARLADGGEQPDTQASLLLRAASGLTSTRDFEGAEAAYAALVQMGDGGRPHWESLDAVRRRLGKHEEVIESLLARLEQEQDATARAKLMATIGDIYARDLDDPSQAVVALSQALCEAPAEREIARRIEEVAGGDRELWSEVLSTCSEASGDEDAPARERVPLLEQMGTWYSERLSKPELALPCFQTALKLDPKSVRSLEGVAGVYRHNRMWSELGELLVHRADVAGSPSDARELRTQAALVLEKHLNDADGAQELYERILREDPGDLVVGQALGRIYEANNELDRLVPLLERQIEEERGARRHVALCRLGDLYRQHLGDLERARACFQAVLEEEPAHVEAADKLDQTLAQAGQFKDLLASLHRQLENSPTPRQQVTLWERIAKLYEEEFLLHADAAVALERVLALDPSRTSAMATLERLYRTLEKWRELAELYQRHADQLENATEQAEILTQRARVLAEHVGDLPAAIDAYEQISHLVPDRVDPLEAIADLHEALGNGVEAIQTLQNVADRAAEKDVKVRCFLRTARLLEAEGLNDESLDWYRRVIALDPTHAKAAQALRTAYKTRGNASGMLELLRRDRDLAEGSAEKARLSTEIASIQLEELNDPEAAEDSARQALEFDPSNLKAAMLVGRIAHHAGRHSDAMEAYQSVLPRLESLPTDDAVLVLSRYLDAADASPTRAPEMMLRYANRLVELAPDDRKALERAALLSFDHGSPAQTISYHQTLLTRFADGLPEPDRAQALFRLGETERASDNLELAIEHLSESLELAPRSAETLEALARAYEAREDWTRLTELKLSLIDLVDADRKAELLAEIGEVALDKLSAPDKALDYFLAAMDQQPDNRRVLTRLMQLHTQQESWKELVEVVDKLASFVDDPKQKCKYLVTAAMVSARQLNRKDQAVEYYKKVLTLDPDHQKALSECVVLQIELGDSAGAERALRSRLEMASARADVEAQVEMLDALFALYQATPAKLDQAIEVVDKALALQPDDPIHVERLKELLERDPRHIDRAASLHMATLRARPDDEQSYRRLRKLYTEARRADAAWCLCQVLQVLRIAEPEELRFFERHHSSEPIPAQTSLEQSDWDAYITHPSADPRVTEIFSLIEPVVVHVRGQPLTQLGYDPRLALDLSQHPYPLGHMLYFAAGVMGMTPPMTFENHHEPGGLLYLNSAPPSIVMGVSALQQLPTQTAAFIAARQLANYRPGFLLRHVLSTVPVLKAWMFAAFRCCSPSFPVGQELEGPVMEAKAALDQHLPPASRDRLVEAVSRMLQGSPSIDLKAWVAGVDLTADRVGLLVANDLRSVTDIIKTVEDPTAPPRDRRLQEIILYAIDTPFLAVRERLGVALESLV